MITRRRRMLRNRRRQNHRRGHQNGPLGTFSGHSSTPSQRRRQYVLQLVRRRAAMNRAEPPEGSDPTSLKPKSSKIGVHDASN